MSDELDLIDLTVKQFTRPTLHLDTFIIAKRLDEVKHLKQNALSKLGVDRTEFMSDARFSQLLLNRTSLSGDDLPTAPSPTSGKMRVSYAKHSPGVQKLLEHPEAGEYMKTRLLLKSTQEETRLERLLNIDGGAANRDGVRYRQLNVPLMYYGAHTGRFSGKDYINLQNLGRGSVLREAIVAPPGHQIIAADLSQIEARLTAAFCGQDDLLEQFARGEDVYSKFASEHYGFEVNGEDHPKERFVGKTGILSLGFQSGAPKFHATMNNVFNTPISEDEAWKVVDTYRKKYKHIVSAWRKLDKMIKTMADGYGTVAWGPVTFAKRKVILPNNMEINYHQLQRDPSSHGWCYESSKAMSNHLYGGKLLENIIQALARIIMTRAMLRTARSGWMPALHVHDELVYVVKNESVALMMGAIKAVMEDPVEWMPQLPIKCEVKSGNNYAECK